MPVATVASVPAPLLVLCAAASVQFGAALAKTLFDEKGIQTVVGVSGTLDETIEALRRGELRGGESLCGH